jgi:hypothetical protein
MKSRLQSLILSPPAALRQGIARAAVDHVVAVEVVDHVVAVEVLAPVTTRGPQTGNRAGGCRPCSCSRCTCSWGPCSHPITQSPPAALSQGVARAAVDHVVVVGVLAPVTTRGPQTGNRAGGCQLCGRSRCTCSWGPCSHPITQSPPAALRQGIARDVVDHEVEVDVNVNVSITTRGPQAGYRAGGSRP